ncbi:3-phosphoshikimate 1-carboxyvinyltransferase [Marinilabilia rubra]|uniref:3-phosphoshikimate 1-carboxyvinyltransferase n=1 Tax=Marinilabilia rubra TaxID=2162893 RepID=A0A2U2BA90_9BACT|nr:3-phosphoshikimate 1-carboxyvinyltransferase [Marinilabilia rubra]PWD99952.1 3-phosphoshikimate 1-carboxyvinyltransferase [Marinilabilia rubra]
MTTIKLTSPKELDQTTIDLPSSKSISNRLLILNALSYSPWPVKNLSESDDTRALEVALTSNASVFNVGAAGTTMRFLTAFLSRIVGEWTITGSERMKERPIGVLVEALRELGANIEYAEKEGFPPLKLLGSSLQGKTLELPGNISSQYISALLMIAPAITDGLTLKLKGDITSKPYINLTLKLMELYGVKSEWNGNTISVAEQPLKPVEVKAEGDWSAASYWFQIVALSEAGASVALKGLDRYSLQGDSAVADLFKQLGVKHKFSQKGLILTNNGEKSGSFKYDFTHQPDLAQTFAMTCAALDIPFHLTGLHTLKIKETDRIQALINEAGKFGYAFTTNDVDDLKWDGAKSEPRVEPLVATYHDHRMAMAFAPLAIKHGAFSIENPVVVSKSYPGYWDDLMKAGFNVKF